MKAHFVAALICGTLLLLSTALGKIQNPESGANRNSASGRENKNAEIYAELGKAPQKARERANPLEHDPDAVVAGRLLFEDHCAECHGAKAEGGKKAPSLRVPEVQTVTPGTLFWLLTNGVVRKGMPVWSKLPEPQRWALVRYLKSLGVAERSTEAPPSTPSNR
jgi:mono/diheme cytochrome c family protein